MNNAQFTNEDLYKIIANILYLDSTESINEDTPLFTGLDLTSIDYIDLCYELKKISGKEVAPEGLWPFNKMLRDSNLYNNEQWTEEGWKQVCSILKIDGSAPKESIENLYSKFNVAYIMRRLFSL